MELDLSRIYNKKIVIKITSQEQADEFFEALREQYPEHYPDFKFKVIDVQHFFRLHYFNGSSNVFGHSLVSADIYTRNGFTVEEFDYLVVDEDDSNYEKYNIEEIQKFLMLGGENNDSC